MKCGQYFQLMRDSECSHVQCTRCHGWFCWTCLSPAKGQKHFKENPQCKDLTFLPDVLSQDIKEKFITEGQDYVNLKFCARCPCCKGLNEKRSRVNRLEC